MSVMKLDDLLNYVNSDRSTRSAKRTNAAEVAPVDDKKVEPNKSIVKAPKGRGSIRSEPEAEPAPGERPKAPVEVDQAWLLKVINKHLSKI